MNDGNSAVYFHSSATQLSVIASVVLCRHKGSNSQSELYNILVKKTLMDSYSSNEDVLVKDELFNYLQVYSK